MRPANFVYRASGGWEVESTLSRLNAPIQRCSAKFNGIPQDWCKGVAGPVPEGSSL